jgi:hypothetical protein
LIERKIRDNDPDNYRDKKKILQNDITRIEEEEEEGETN